MRKVVSVILSVVLCMSLSSCSKKTSNLSVETFESVTKLLFDDFSFDLEENESGYALSFVDGNYKYSGNADKEKKITEITLTYGKYVDMSLMTEEKIGEIMYEAARDISKVSQQDLNAMALYIRVTSFFAAIEAGKEGEENNESEEKNKSVEKEDIPAIYFNVITGKEKAQFNDWEIEGTPSDSSVIITAKYVGG